MLNANEESQWGARRRGEGLDARGLARLLKPFKTGDGLPIKPKQVRVGDATLKGYHVDQFRFVFVRYLPDPKHAKHAKHPPRDGTSGVSDVSHVSHTQDFATPEQEDLFERYASEWGEVEAAAAVHEGLVDEEAAR